MARYKTHRECPIEIETRETAKGFGATWRTYAQGATVRGGAEPKDSGQCGPYVTEGEAERQAEARAKESVDRMLGPEPRRR